MPKLKCILSILLILVINTLSGQNPNEDDKLHISLNNALIMAGAYFFDYMENKPIVSTDPERLDNDISLFILRNYPISSLAGHTITVSTASYDNKWGEDKLSSTFVLKYVINVEKIPASSRYKLTVSRPDFSRISLSDQAVQATDMLYSIVFDESVTGIYEYCWYEHNLKKYDKKSIRLIRSADGLARPNVFGETGNLVTILAPVTLDGYGRITRWSGVRKSWPIEYADNYTYTARHHVATNNFKRRLYDDRNPDPFNTIVIRITDDNSGFQVFRQKDTYRFKRGRMDEVTYFDMGRLDNTRRTGIQMLKRIYIHQDRNDIRVYNNTCITKKQREEYIEKKRKEEQLREEERRKEEARKKEEERHKEEVRKEHKKAEEELLRRLQERDQLKSKVEAIRANDTKIRRLTTDHPEIYAAYYAYVRLYVTDDLHPNIMKTPREKWPSDKLEQYTFIQNQTLVALNNEKNCKKLNRALKKAGSKEEQTSVFARFSGLQVPDSKK